MEGEALAARIVEMGPVTTKFLGPVVIEIPHFASLRGREREIMILRSENGETWREHVVDASEEVGVGRGVEGWPGGVREGETQRIRKMTSGAKTEKSGRNT